jgi:CRP-like cAMP-binding protein
LAQRLSVERYAPGDDVVREGEAGGKLFIVAAGELEVLARGGSSVAELRAGDYFGEMALLSGQARSATVRAIDRCELYALDPEDFVALLRDNPAIAEAVEAVVAQRRAALDYVTAAV